MQQIKKQTGLTLVELMVALAIGSFLIIGAVQIYNQSRHAFVINESIARVQETAQFAMDTIESDLRMASNWGRTSRSLAIEGRSLAGDPNPKNMPGVPLDCGADWVLDLAVPVDGSNNNFNLPCAATGGAQATSDLITVRRATVLPQAPTPGRLQIQTTRVQGEVFDDGVEPPMFQPVIPADPVAGTPASSETAIIDQEIAPGVENLQVQLGIDVDEDNTVDRYVNPGDEIYDPAAAGYVPGARVITARVWLVVRGVNLELGIQDNRDYEPGDVDLGTFNDQVRRMQVSKTILLRNSRT